MLEICFFFFLFTRRLVILNFMGVMFVHCVYFFYEIHVCLGESTFLGFQLAIGSWRGCCSGCTCWWRSRCWLRPCCTRWSSLRSWWNGFDISARAIHGELVASRILMGSVTWVLEHWSLTITCLFIIWILINVWLYLLILLRFHVWEYIGYVLTFNHIQKHIFKLSHFCIVVRVIRWRTCLIRHHETEAIGRYFGHLIELILALYSVFFLLLLNHRSISFKSFHNLLFSPWRQQNLR